MALLNMLIKDIENIPIQKIGSKIRRDFKLFIRERDQIDK